MESCQSTDRIRSLIASSRARSKGRTELGGQLGLPEGNDVSAHGKSYDDDVDVDHAANSAAQCRSSSVVELNVGGHCYMTTRDTLERSVYFLNLLSERFGPPLMDGHGRYFIDRDGTHFGVVLNYLRCHEIDLELPGDVRRAVEREAEFFCIELPPPCTPAQATGKLGKDAPVNVIYADVYAELH